jgi:internalin A
MLLDAAESLDDLRVPRVTAWRRLAVIARDNTAYGLTTNGGSASDLDLLRSVPNLEELDLAGTQVGRGAIQKLRGMARLRSLRLDKCNVGDEDLAQLDGLPQLVNLYLHRTRITDEGLAHLAKCPNLTLLAIGDCDISDDGLRNLRALRHLQLLLCGKVYCHKEEDRPRITDAAIEHLAPLKSLKEIMLFHTRLSPEGFKRLQAALPEARIVVE